MERRKEERKERERERERGGCKEVEKVGGISYLAIYTWSTQR